MKTRYSEDFENDTTPSRVVVEEYRKIEWLEEDNQADDWPGLGLAQYRGGQIEFELGEEYCRSPDPLDRATGADLLGQLGWNDLTFLEESVDVLIPMLQDVVPLVVRCAAIALGHRGEPRAIPALLEIVDHPDASVRGGVVHGLSRHEDADAIAALIKLSADSAHDVRNWAVFGLGSMVKWDSEALRGALFAALGDPDSEVRGEALVGLALRRDERVVEALLREWGEHEFIDSLSLDAAEEIADTRLLPRLEKMIAKLDLEGDPKFEWFRSDVLRAMQACRGEKENL